MGQGHRRGKYKNRLSNRRHSGKGIVIDRPRSWSLCQPANYCIDRSELDTSGPSHIKDVRHYLHESLLTGRRRRQTAQAVRPPALPAGRYRSRLPACWPSSSPYNVRSNRPRQRLMRNKSSDDIGLPARRLRRSAPAQQAASRLGEAASASLHGSVRYPGHGTRRVDRSLARVGIGGGAVTQASKRIDNTLDMAFADIAGYIEVFRNRTRRHRHSSKPPSCSQSHRHERSNGCGSRFCSRPSRMTADRATRITLLRRSA